MIWYQLMSMKILFPSVLKKNNLIIILIAALSLAWLGWPSGALAQQPVAPTRSAAADILLSGKLVCSVKRVVIVPFFGITTALPVQAGQKVAQGDLLARYRLFPESVVRIRSRLFPNDIRDLELALVRLDIKLSELENKRAGLQKLARNNLTSQQSLDTMENEIPRYLSRENSTGRASEVGSAAP